MEFSSVPRLGRASRGWRARAVVGVLAAGGTANAAAQDSFCANTSCAVTVVYDQSGRGNDLRYPGSSVVPGSSQSRSAIATSEPSWNPNQRAFPNRFVTTTLKNNGTTRFAGTGQHQRRHRPDRHGAHGARTSSGQLTVYNGGDTAAWTRTARAPPRAPE